MKPGYFVGGVVIFFCIVVTAMALSGAVRRTVTFQEALTSQQPCEVYGEVVKNSAKLDANGRFSFKIKEVKGSSELSVVSLKPKPSNFDQADHVKAIGVAEGNQFVAHDLLVKCPSKYQGAEKEQKAGPAQSASGSTGRTETSQAEAFAAMERSRSGGSR
jgi:cytochrome c-type biogenesis protein CcmE